MRIIRSISLATVSLCLAIISNGQTNVVQTEKDFYSLRTIVIPQEIKLEVGGVAVMPDGRIAASTRRGKSGSLRMLTDPVSLIFPNSLLAFMKCWVWPTGMAHSIAHKGEN